MLTLLTLLLLATPKLSASDWVIGNPENIDWTTYDSPEDNWTLWDSYGNQDWCTLPSDMVLEMIIGKEDYWLFGLNDDKEDDLEVGGDAGNKPYNDGPVGDGVGIILLLIAVYALRNKQQLINI